ncbi:twin-arginine translocation signal domain-containing protein [Streptomyces parvus]|uniref:twin-arginine translocation signal domain-containing protein n=1 Tax=Streptomyces parvus TaxID=66428 RepID=UPI003334706C
MSPVPAEDAYDRIRMRQGFRGRARSARGRARSAGIDRRDLLKLVATASAAVPPAPVAAPASR